ncbi:MAG: M1 family metallopeptidase [Chitinophagaceae bacterium]|nr:M1 family metallopeptidase [Chitinophagaceae bacterium]
MTICSVICFFVLVSCSGQPLQQKKKFTRQDTLRGSITPERAWWDVVSYHVAFNTDYNNRAIEGKCEIQFRVLKPGNRMQVDLQQPMQISRAYSGDDQYKFTREGNIYYINFPQPLKKDSLHTIVIVFRGNPKIAVHPPWQGGWIFAKDSLGRPWMSVACQGLGASAWYPCKDHQSDEPDSAFINITIPDTLVAVANGRFMGKQSFSAGLMTYRWAVTNPINNYNIVPYIGKYASWDETYNGEKGKLDCQFWVLDYNLQKAKQQFRQVPAMLKCFEYWFGPYPFYEDSYKLVESPHLGMEHQSAIAYGNKYQNGYLGNDLSGTGWGKKWDFIIVHESGHEWFANNITTNDIADMWIHEGFTTYSEVLFTECEFGKEAGNDYLTGIRKSIENDIPVVGPYGVNQEGSGDMYPKGANLLHTIRQIINDDNKFRQILRGLNAVFYHKTVNSKDVEEYISKESGTDFSKLFDQYLRTIKIPVLEYKLNARSVSYRWSDCVEAFDMKVKIKLGDEKQEWIQPARDWKTLDLSNGYDGKTFIVDRNFYILTKKTD